MHISVRSDATRPSPSRSAPPVLRDQPNSNGPPLPRSRAILVLVLEATPAAADADHPVAVLPLRLELAVKLRDDGCDRCARTAMDADRFAARVLVVDYDRQLPTVR